VGFNDLELYRKFYINGKLDGAYHQHNYLKFPVYNNMPKVGFDFTQNDKTVIGLVAAGLRSQYISTTNNSTIVEDGDLLQ